MNQNSQSFESSSPHDKYKAAVKFRSRVKRALAFGTFVSVISITGVAYIYMDLTSENLKIEQVQMEEKAINGETESIMPVSMDMEDANFSDSDQLSSTQASYLVHGMQKEGKTLRFVLESRDPSQEYKIDLGNGIMRKVSSDTVAYKYKQKGRFMTYLLMLEGYDHVKVDSQFIEIRGENSSGYSKINKKKDGRTTEYSEIDQKK